MSTETIGISGQSTMAEVLMAAPGAQRALFRRYHIGGCASCGFQPTETLAQVCARNNLENVDEVIAHIQASHEQDSKVLITPAALAELRNANPALALLDVRSREEFEAVKMEGALMMSQPVVQEIMAKWPRETVFVIYDHSGKTALDAAAYFIGHGFPNVRCLDGGIDAYARDVEPTLPRYRLG